MLVFIEHSTHRMHLGGITANPASGLCSRPATLLSASASGSKTSSSCSATADRTSPPRSTPSSRPLAPGYCVPQFQAPRMNATRERLVSTLRREILGRVLILGEAHVPAVLTECQVHYTTARPHQGISQHVPTTNLTLPAPP
jgi:putative transposase